MAKNSMNSKSKLRIKTGDDVIVIAGKDKGRTGKILRVLPSKARVFVEGVNMIKKHVKQNPHTGEGGIVDKEAALHISNVAIYNPISKKADRIGYRTLDDGKKVRVFKSTGEMVDIQ